MSKSVKNFYKLACLVSINGEQFSFYLPIFIHYNKSQIASPSNNLPPSSNCVCHHAPQKKMQKNVNTETRMLTMISDNILLRL